MTSKLTAPRYAMVIVAIMIATSGGPASAQPSVDPSVAHGAHIAARDCASCHAVSPTGESRSAAAPPFRVLRLRFNPISLERRLAAIPPHGHHDMPPRALAATDVPDLVAYIQTLEPARRTP